MWRERLAFVVLTARIRIKWLRDKFHLPLTVDLWELYLLCHRISWKELRDLPNLISPRDYNDRIQWLKLFDQSEEHVRCSDKIAVRDYVRERVGEKYLVKLYQTCERFDNIDFDKLPKSFVIKCNHDSGGVVLVRDIQKLDKSSAEQRLEESLGHVYGWDNGEWAYAFVRPRLLVEEFIQPHLDSPPPDYKFHCVEGKIKWLQYIYDRKLGTKEVIVSRGGEVVDCHFDHNMISTRDFIKPPEWEEMLVIAETLAKGWKYVRVDLYLSGGRIYVGELTFFPLFGCYQSEGQKQLGQFLDFDRTTFKPPIHHRLQRPV
jgi:hypothetical protein